jgi:Ca2+-binding EF-hand superfamily protein
MLLAGCGSSPSLTTPSPATSVSAQSKASYNDLVNATRSFLRLKFEETDRDKSGFLTVNEAGGSGRSYVLGQETIGTFADVDANRDGKLSFEEFGANPIVMRIAHRLHGQLVQMFAAADRDGDMVLRSDEIPPGFDTNQDGRVDFDEYESAYAAILAKGDSH